ncbi:MAG: glycosyltransferase family 2 protein [Lachnospiraceae bacterium]|nr:glycosyltransferase family 2 protein [Lachnospiraceae bacterium]
MDENHIASEWMEYRNIYESVRENFTPIAYEELGITCKQISEQCYQLYDEIEQEVLETVNLAEMEIDGYIPEFESLLVADCWNVWTVVKMLGNSYPQSIYMIPSDIRKFSGFLLIPGFAERFMQNYLVLPTINILEDFFTAYSEFYLPKRVLACNNEYYEGIIDRIHQSRIEDESERERNVFLSICVPSYNRGKLALEAVQHLQKLPYDEEIEIIVSNNFSDKGEEAYEEIANIQDSRLRYYRTTEQLRFGGNVATVLSQAKGKYVLFQSDEDRLINDNLPEYLDFLSKYGDIAFVCASGIGENLTNEQVDAYSDDLVDCVCTALDRNYLTGMLINRELVKDSDLSVFWKLFSEGNMYALYYAHCYFMARLAGRGHVISKATPLYVEGKSDGAIEKETLYRGLGVEKRVEQFSSLVEIISRYFELTKDQEESILIRRIGRIYDLVALGFTEFQEEYMKNGRTRADVFSYLHEEIGKIVSNANKSEELLYCNDKCLKQVLQVAG